jgi:hypothetical protein
MILNIRRQAQQNQRAHKKGKRGAIEATPYHGKLLHVVVDPKVVYPREDRLNVKAGDGRANNASHVFDQRTANLFGLHVRTCVCVEWE